MVEYNEGAFFDIVLRAAAEEVAKIRSGNAKPSEAHEKKIMELLEKARPKQRRAWPRVAAAIAAAIIAMSAAALAFAPSVMSAVANRALQWLSQYAAFGEPRPETSEGMPSPSHLPEGFSLKSSSNAASLMIKIYSSDNRGEIYYCCASKDAAMMANSENVEHGEIVINAIAYHTLKSTKDGVSNAVLWEHGDMQFLITSLLPLEELLQVAQSVEY